MLEDCFITIRFAVLFFAGVARCVRMITVYIVELL